MLYQIRHSDRSLLWQWRFLLALQEFLTDSANYALNRGLIKNSVFHGNESVVITYKLCLMNLYLHNIENIYGFISVKLGDSLLTDLESGFYY